MIISLPKPPSINHIYGFTSRGGFARSYITKVGKAWFEEAGYRLRSQVPSTVFYTTPIRVAIKLFTARRQDADNILKPILDLLQKQHVIENDALVNYLSVEKLKSSVSKEHVEIEISSY